MSKRTIGNQSKTDSNVWFYNVKDYHHGAKVAQMIRERGGAVDYFKASSGKCWVLKIKKAPTAKKPQEILYSRAAWLKKVYNLVGLGSLRIFVPEHIVLDMPEIPEDYKAEDYSWTYEGTSVLLEVTVHSKGGDCPGEGYVCPISGHVFKAGEMGEELIITLA